MTEEECLRHFGLRPTPEQAEAVKTLLEEQTTLETSSQGRGNTQLMKLLCAQLFNTHAVEHSLVIWTAKTSSMDADASIDIQLMCGAGVPETRRFLLRVGEQAALARLDESLNAGDLDDFSADEYANELERYYASEQ